VVVQGMRLLEFGEVVDFHAFGGVVSLYCPQNRYSWRPRQSIFYVRHTLSQFLDCSLPETEAGHCGPPGAAYFLFVVFVAIAIDDNSVDDL